MNNKFLAVFLGAGLFSMQAQAVVIESITGESFAGYANTFVGTNTTLWTDLGSAATTTNWSTDATINAGRVTDTSAATSVLGDTVGAYVDLAFDASIFNGAGDDLKLFFVGGNGQGFSVTIGGITNNYNLAANVGDTTFVDPAYPTDPIISLALNLDSFSGLTTGDSYNQIRVMIGDGYAPATSPSAVLSFVGTYNTSPVPVPAAVWLFGSGLIGLVGVARRRK